MKKRIAFILLGSLLLTSCSSSDTVEQGYETRAFPEISETSQTSVATVVTEEIIEAEVPEISIEYDSVTGRYTGYEVGDNYTITYNAVNLSEGRIPDTVNVYTTHIKSDTQIYDLNETNGRNIRIACGEYDNIEVTGEQDNLEVYNYTDSTISTVTSPEMRNLIFEAFQTYRIETRDNDTVNDFCEILEELFPDIGFTQYALTCEYLPYMNYLEFDASNENNLSTQYYFRNEIDGIPFQTSVYCSNYGIGDGRVRFDDKTGFVTFISDHQFFRLHDNTIGFAYPMIQSLNIYEENLPIIPLEDCIDKSIRNIRSHVISWPDEFDFIVYAAELIYIPVIESDEVGRTPIPSDNCYLLPVWAIYWYDGGLSPSAHSNCSYINAVSGELIYG